MPAPVMGDHAKAAIAEKQQLTIPCVGRKRPSVRERTMESAILGTMDDIDTLRAKLLAEADSMQIESSRPDSKAAKIRALYPTLVEIKERSPHVTYVTLAKMLTKIGIDVKADAVMKAMASVREAG
jgi:hypothetical protein